MPQTNDANNESEANNESSVIELLKADHRAVEELFEQYKNASDSEEKKKLARQIANELMVHTLIEEEIFYPACREHMESPPLDEAQVEHDCAKLLIGELLAGGPDEAFYDAKVTVLSEEIKHHVKEEEKRSDGIFALAKKNGVPLDALAERVRSRKVELKAQAEKGALKAATPRSFKAQANRSSSEQEMNMARQHYDMPERDDRGRFVSDDDDRRYRSAGRSQGGGRYRDDDDYDERVARSGRGHGGWSGDPEGHSEASRRGWEERQERQSRSGGESRSEGRYDDDNRHASRFSGSRNGDRDQYEDDRPRRSSSRNEDYRNEDYDDDRRSMRSQSGRGQGGWYGDSEAHSEASRRGWDNPDRGSSGWYGDSRRHSEASRRGWDNPDHRPSGWFGDSEGHSQAARERWEQDDDGRRSRGGNRQRRYD